MADVNGDGTWTTLVPTWSCRKGVPKLPFAEDQIGDAEGVDNGLNEVLVESDFGEKLFLLGMDSLSLRWDRVCFKTFEINAVSV